MNKIKKYKIANLYFWFENFYENGLWNTWSWKIDPFVYAKSEKPQLTISCKDVNIDEIMTRTVRLLHQQRSGFFFHSVYLLDNGNTLWCNIRDKSNIVYLAYQVSYDWNTITLLTDKTGTNGNIAFEYINQMIPGILLKHDFLTFHGALLEYNNYSFAVCAASGTGKTTHARLWRDYKNALIINGDRTVIKKTDDGWQSYGIPWSGTSGEQINRTTLLKAMIVLQRADYNEIHRLSPMEALPLFFPQLLYPSWDKVLVDKAMDLFDLLLKEIPVYRLCCKPDEEAVNVLYSELER